MLLLLINNFDSYFNKNPQRKILPFIEDVEEAREKISELNTEIIGEEMDAEIVQDNDECNVIGEELHPDFEVQHPDFFFEGDIPPAKTVSSFHKIDLWDNKTIRTRIRTLDTDQRFVLDLRARKLRIDIISFVCNV